MKKETFADKFARKSFESPQIQQSWQVHFQAFKPILEPAFVNNYQAKIHLTAALNFICNHNFAKGLTKLQGMEKYIETDADKAAYLFFMGLFCEMTGDLPQMAELYDYANEYGHNFYLPYMKAGKFHLQSCEYDIALDNFADAIDCFDMDCLTEQEIVFVASNYFNMVTCLTMMHQYEDAMKKLEEGHSFGVEVPGSASAEAVLYAVIGQREKAEDSLEQLKAEDSLLYEKIKTAVDSIFDETNPAFFKTAIDDEKIDSFWSWFSTYGSTLRKHFDREEYEDGMTVVTDKLLETFPFMEEPPFLCVGENVKGYVIELHDLYFVAVNDAFSKLMSACPPEIKKDWQFALVH